MIDQFDLDDLLILPYVDEDDVNQEVELLKLMGIEKPNKSIIRARLAKARELLYSEKLPRSARVLEYGLDDTSNLSLSQIEQLTEWALEQEDETACEMVLGFLDNPSEAALATILKYLVNHNLISRSNKKLASKKTTEQPKSVSLGSLILKTLSCEHQTPIEQLYELGRSVLHSNRPEAAVRQALRRLLSSRQIKEVSPKIYSVISQGS